MVVDKPKSPSPRFANRRGWTSSVVVDCRIPGERGLNLRLSAMAFVYNDRVQSGSCEASRIREFLTWPQPVGTEMGELHYLLAAHCGIRFEWRLP
jgi:hypothetical protein